MSKYRKKALAGCRYVGVRAVPLLEPDPSMQRRLLSLSASCVAQASVSLKTQFRAAARDNCSRPRNAARPGGGSGAKLHQRKTSRTAKTPAYHGDVRCVSRPIDQAADLARRVVLLPLQRGATDRCKTRAAWPPASQLAPSAKGSPDARPPAALTAGIGISMRRYPGRPQRGCGVPARCL